MKPHHFIPFVLQLFLPGLGGALNAQINGTWYFGVNGGVDFSSGTPVAITGPLVALEGTSVISDPDGALLFYSNGETIWDRTHTAMPNGEGLAGGASSAQAALIVPQPGACGIYHVITTGDHLGTGDLRYSTVDMCLNDGNGDVVQSAKNILLSPNMGEMLTAVPHANGVDIWILTHQRASQTFKAYRLTPDGWGTTPVESNVGDFHGSTCAIGMMKASHDGSRLVITASFCDIAQMFDFNTASGIISSPVTFSDHLWLPQVGMYGMEFSPNDQVLYLVGFWGTSRLFQIDLSDMSSVILAEFAGNYVLGGIQLGPDGRIYCTRQYQPFLDVITAPNVVGTGCNLTPEGFALLPGTSGDLGLPNMMPAYITVPPPAAPLTVDLGPDLRSCSFPLQLDPGFSCNAELIWNDGSSQTTYSVLGPGTYWVEVSTECGQGSDTIVVEQSDLLELDLGPDTVLCPGMDIVLLPGNGASLLWQDGTDSPSYPVSAPGVYHATLSADGCTASDTVVVEPPPGLDLGPDTLLCASEGHWISTGLDGAHDWSTGSNASGILVTRSGTYHVNVLGTCGPLSDTLSITFTPQWPPFEDRVICTDSILLSIEQPVQEILWSNGSTNPWTMVAPGTYGFLATDTYGCVRTDALEILGSLPVSGDLFPNVFTPNADGVNDRFEAFPPLRIRALIIFDRWGLVIHQGNTDWNGRTTSGEPAPEGTYYFLAEYEDVCSGVLSTLHGAITLLR